MRLSTLLLAALAWLPAWVAAADEAPATAASAPTAPPDSGITANDAEPTPQANPSPKAAATAEAATHQPAPSQARFFHLSADPQAYSIVGAASGLSLHKPMYLEPATYSPQYTGSHTEAVFQLSLKLRLFSYPDNGALYFGYTQKSFFDAYDKAQSSPFRETDYNPEGFYRYIPADAVKWHHLGIDVGFEHNSNGKSLPDSRSWNRVYIAPFQAEGEHLFYLKLWYRIPENENLPRTDPRRDDNPDIQDYYGYGEFIYEQQFFNDQLLRLMLRFNTATSRGAVEAQYSIPGPGHRFFWGLIFFSGYGDSLIDYNRSVTRVGLAVMLAR